MENQAQQQSHIQQQRQKADLLKKEICLLLNWTEMEFCNYQHQQGIAYLMWYLPCDEWGRSRLERSKLYWNWYKNLWTAYDESFLTYRQSLRECTATHLVSCYAELHCPRQMVRFEKPNAVVLSSLKETA